ncbi:Ig-like domain-containing protein [Pacificibacter marinus]|uniref:Ig-like domain-containing protein n=1 Tax=Pacificibacter marinus TaxID=658057 RepID=UPI001114671A|nr:Ig-like domain-containing protein [Pacificibacter marinus]
MTALSQQGAVGTYAAQDYIGVSFEATRTTDGDRYAYRAEINGATATTITVSQTLVNAAPTITLGSPSGPDGSGKYTVIATLSENSTDFTVDDLTLTNATATFSGSGSSYTIVLTQIAVGAVKMSVPKKTFADSEGLENGLASNEVEFAGDTSPPAVSIAAFTGPLNGNQSAVITLSEASTNFVVGDLTLTNASATLSGSGISYTAVLTPTADGEVKLSVAAGTFTDAVGNDNTASNEVTTTVDTVAPSVTLTDFIVTTGPPVPGWYGTTLTLSEPSPNFSSSSVQLSPNVSNWGFNNPSPTVYEIYINPPSGSDPVTLSIPAGLFTDAAGNPNTASREITYTPDSTPPTVSIADFTGALNGPQTAVITLSEDSTDFVLADLTLTNATAVLTGSGTSYTAVLTPIADGPVALSVGVGVFSDAAGNTNAVGADQVTTTYDSTAPTVSISTNVTAVSGAEAINVVVTFSEAVTGFEASDIVVVNGSATNVTGSGADYVVQITATGNGDTTVSVPAAAAIDDAGNSSKASNTVSIQNSTVEMTQKVIAQFMQSRANQLVSSQPNLTRFLSGGGAGGFNMSVTRAGGNFHFASSPDTNNGLWVRLNGTWTNEDTSKTKYVFGALGHHYTVSPNLLIGGMVEFDFVSQNDGAATLDGQGWLTGLYVVTRAPNHPLFIDGRILYGQTTNDVSPLGTYTDSFDTERWLAQVNVSGELMYHATTFIPSVQVTYTTDDQAAYTDGLGNLIPSQGVEIWQAAVGVDFSHQVALQNSKTSLELTGGVAAIGSSTRGSGYANSVTPTYENTRARLKMGANYTMENGARLSIDTFYDGIGVDNYESYGLEVGFNWLF